MFIVCQDEKNSFALKIPNEVGSNLKLFIEKSAAQGERQIKKRS